MTIPTITTNATVVVALSQEEVRLLRLSGPHEFDFSQLLAEEVASFLIYLNEDTVECLKTALAETKDTILVALADDLPTNVRVLGTNAKCGTSYPTLGDVRFIVP
jgi:hypothetical protein